MFIIKGGMIAMDAFRNGRNPMNADDFIRKYVRAVLPKKETMRLETYGDKLLANKVILLSQTVKTEAKLECAVDDNFIKLRDDGFYHIEKNRMSREDAFTFAKFIMQLESKH